MPPARHHRIDRFSLEVYFPSPRCFAVWGIECGAIAETFRMKISPMSIYGDGAALRGLQRANLLPHELDIRDGKAKSHQREQTHCLRPDQQQALRQRQRVG